MPSALRSFPAHVTVLIALGAGLPTPLGAQSAAWQVHAATVTFVVHNAGFPVRGSFEGLRARVCFDPARPEASSLSGVIDPTTIRTGIDMRDRHLQRHGWFDVPRFGMIEMRSVRLREASDGYVGTFLLRIRDVEREAEVPFTFERKGAGAQMAGTLTIDRLDYQLGEPSMVLADDVEIHVDMELVPSGVEAGAADDGGPCR